MLSATRPPLPCPACRAPRAAGEEVCAACGLVFASVGPAAPDAPPLALSLARGRYALLRTLSHGGMGAIYLAVDREVFDRPVVVKAMLDYYDPADPGAAEAARERFRAEARTLAMLRHPAIPQIYSYFEDAGRHYIVMEYIAGRDLDQGLSRPDPGGPDLTGRAYPAEQVARWGVGLCRVLEYLAARQPHPVVHHDIKPANLILDAESGELRLVDFGTARSRLLAQAGAAAARGSGLFGTHGYAPPEQYRGESEPRSDVYALAATLYHLATDDDPAGHPFSFPRLAALGELGAALAPALARAAAQRPDAAQLRAALEGLLAAPAARPLLAPDGTALADLPELARWCRTRWAAAVGWLFADLPDQLAVRRGETSLAARLAEIRRRHADAHHLALDAALALLDPEGYGAALPSLTLSAAGLDFGRLKIDAARTLPIRIRNAGRRCFVGTVELPPWVSVDRPRNVPGAEPRALLQCLPIPAARARRAPAQPPWRLSLPPGAEVELPLRANTSDLHRGGRVVAQGRLDSAAGPPDERFELIVRTPALRMLLARQQHVLAYTLMLLFLLGMCLLTFSL